MQIDIVPIDLSQKPVLRQMMEFYCYDFSDMLNLELSDMAGTDTNISICIGWKKGDIRFL